MSGTPSGGPTVALRHSSPLFAGGLAQLPMSVNDAGALRLWPTFDTHGKAKFARLLPPRRGPGASIVLIRCPLAPLLM